MCVDPATLGAETGGLLNPMSSRSARTIWYLTVWTNDFVLSLLEMEIPGLSLYSWPIEPES